MYNLLLAGGAGVAAYVVGFFVSDWIAGILPALLAFGVAYFFLARRTGRQVEAVFQRVMATLQAGKLDEGRGMLEAAMPLGKWQVLVTQQIHSQLGALDYLQAVGHTVQKQASQAKIRFASARAHLEKAWSRDWRAQATLAALHHREGRPDDAVKVLEKASGAGKTEPLFWALYTFVLNEARRRDEALQVVGRGVRELKDSKPLKEIQDALANKRRPSMRVVGEGWYSFFPEDIPQEQLAQMQGQTAPKKPRPQMTYPQPRR